MGPSHTALPHLQELHRATGFVVHLAVLEGDDLVYLEKIGGRLATAVPTRIGGRRPAHSTALGKALLAYDGTPGATYEHIREHGIAYEKAESVPGFGCIAVPIGPVGSTVAAVSICGPLAHLRFDHRFGAPVRLAATAIWRSLDRNHVTPTLQRRRPVRSTAGVLQPQVA